MLIEATNEITRISTDEKINGENYLEFLKYAGNLYNFINKLKLAISLSDIIFLPTFKGRCTCERHNIKSIEPENEMRIIITKFSYELEDEQKEKVDEILGPLCEVITFNSDSIKFILKKKGREYEVKR